MPSCRDREGRRGSGYILPGNSVFLSSDTGMSGNFVSCIKDVRYRFVFQEGTWICLETLQWERAHLVMMEEPCGFSRVRAGILSYNKELRKPLVLPQGSPISLQVARGSWGLLLSQCRENRPHLGLCLETLCSSPLATVISGLHSRFTWGFRPRLELIQELRSSLELQWVYLGAL